MKCFAPAAALAFAAPAFGTAESRTAAAQPGGYRPAPELVEVQYRPTTAPDRGYYHRQERRAEGRAWRRGRERQIARRAYRAGRRDAYRLDACYGRGRY